MTREHYDTLDEVLNTLDANPDRAGTIRTTLIAGRLIANAAERHLHAIAHVTNVDLDVTRRGGLLDVTFYLTVDGTAPDLSRFFQQVGDMMRQLA